MKGQGEGWVPRYDDLTIAYDAAGTALLLRSSIDVKDGKLALQQPKLR
jgi:hypothetical protein